MLSSWILAQTVSVFLCNFTVLLQERGALVRWHCVIVCDVEILHITSACAESAQVSLTLFVNDVLFTQGRSKKVVEDGNKMPQQIRK